jgi:hypothetical protein
MATELIYAVYYCNAHGEHMTVEDDLPSFEEAVKRMDELNTRDDTLDYTVIVYRGA